MGRLPIGTGCGLAAKSAVLLRVPSPRPLSVRPRGVPLSVLCRSSSVLIIGGPGKVIMRPTLKRCDRALIGTILCRYKRGLSKVGNMVHPKVIRQVSVGAANSLLVYGGSGTRRVLTRRLGRRSVAEGCRTVMRNGLGRSANAMGTPVNQRPASHGGVDAGTPGKQRTIARCHMLREFNGFACVRYRLRANQARRVHIRVSDVKRPVLNSRVCNPTGYPCGLRKRALRTGVLNVARPSAKRCVRFSTPLPSCFGSLLGGLEGRVWM